MLLSDRKRTETIQFVKLPYEVLLLLTNLAFLEQMKQKTDLLSYENLLIIQG